MGIEQAETDDTVHIPPPVLDAYRNKKLIVLFGSGLSRAQDVQGDFPSWDKLPERMLHQVSSRLDPGSEKIQTEADALRARRDERLEVQLAVLDVYKEWLGPGHYSDALLQIFGPRDAKPGAVHAALRELDLPILVTTNYDELMELEEPYPKRRVLTWRTIKDLKFATDRGEKVLLKIHGTVGEPDSVIMTPREYQNLKQAKAYRPTIDALLRDHVVLMVGFGINDPYDLDDAFRADTGAYRDAAGKRYAILCRPTSTDRDRWRRDLNVETISCGRHDDLPAVLRSLRERANAAVPEVCSPSAQIVAGPSGERRADLSARSPESATAPSRAPANTDAAIDHGGSHEKAHSEPKLSFQAQPTTVSGTAPPLANSLIASPDPQHSVRRYRPARNGIPVPTRIAAVAGVGIVVVVVAVFAVMRNAPQHATMQLQERQQSGKGTPISDIAKLRPLRPDGVQLVGYAAMVGTPDSGVVDAGAAGASGTGGSGSTARKSSGPGDSVRGDSRCRTECRIEGRCTWQAGDCVAKTAAQCRASEDCRTMKYCTLAIGRCVKTE